MLKAGAPIQEIADLHPRIAASGGVERLRGMLLPERNINDWMQVIVYWGDAGSGKTRMAFAEATMDGIPFYIKTAASGRWWDGYKGEKAVIWDDFRPTEDGKDGVHLSIFLTLTQPIPTRVEFKGGTIPFLAVKIWITSNYNPKLWYHTNTEQWPAVQRRITQVKHFGRRTLRRNDTDSTPLSLLRVNHLTVR